MIVMIKKKLDIFLWILACGDTAKLRRLWPNFYLWRLYYSWLPYIPFGAHNHSWYTDDHMDRGELWNDHGIDESIRLSYQGADGMCSVWPCRQVKVRDQDVPLLTKTEAWVKSLDDAIVISDEEKEAETEKAAATDVPKKEEPVNPDELPDIEPIDTLLEKKPKAEAPKKGQMFKLCGLTVRLCARL